jgi:alkylhydroperoxidase/carboxymuconolactone decarboxylase family protein YurZ
MNDTSSASRREGTLGRIRALMAKTVENGCTEAEAAAAAAKVDELIATYEIDIDEVTMRKQEFLQATVSDAYLHPVGRASGYIARFCDCKVWLDRGGPDKKWRHLVYFGFEVDTQIAEYLTLMFKRAIDREATAFLLFNPDYDAANKAGKRELQRSFGIGMALRLGERLGELKSKRDYTAKEAGRALVVLKMPAVNEALDKLGIHFSSVGAESGPKNRRAYNAGQAAAAHVAIRQGVADRAQRQGGILV